MIESTSKQKKERGVEYQRNPDIQKALSKEKTGLPSLLP
jgi:hypothetical protein